MRGEELLAGGVFLVSYSLIVTERLHRTLAALLGAVIDAGLEPRRDRHARRPPNIIIGSRLDKDFNDFLLNAAPAAIASLVAISHSRGGSSEMISRARCRPWRRGHRAARDGGATDPGPAPHAPRPGGALGHEAGRA